MASFDELPEDECDGSRRSARVDQLADAIDAFLDYRAGPASEGADDFLERNAPLRDLLEPMLACGDGPRDGEPVGDAGPPEAGQCLGDYRIVREIGRGGMGIVYEAEQLSLHRRVALKLLHEHLTGSAKAIEQFRREAAATSGLRHPGIVPIHEVGEWRGRHYFTMEFLTGQPLHVAMTNQRLGLRSDCGRAAEAAELVARVGDALQHAHDHGLVHRDVKPHNIMVGNDRSVRLLDFGLVKYQEADGESVTAGFLGTPHYCSPEQVRGEHVGPASDVFSLGVVLYELVGGRRPFAGETAREVLRNIESGDFESLSRVAPGVPRDLRTICEKAMEPSPSERYRTAGEMVADLRRFLRIEPILATPPGTIVRCGKWVRRHRVPVALWAAALSLLVGIPVAYAVHQQRMRAVVEAERGRLERTEQVAFRGIVQTLGMLAELQRQQPWSAGGVQPRIDEVVRLCEAFFAAGDPDPARTLQVARAYKVIAEIRLNLDDADGAEQASARAQALLDRRPGAGATAADNAIHDRLRGRLMRLRMRIALLRDPAAGGEECELALAHWSREVGRPDASITAIVDYCETLVGRARALSSFAGRRAEAERLLRSARQLLTAERRRAAPAAETVAIRASCALGHTAWLQGRVDEARHAFDDVVRRTDGAKDPVRGAEHAIAQAGLAQIAKRSGDLDAAIAAYDRAVAQGRELVRRHPGVRFLTRAVANTCCQRARLSIERRDFAAAEALLREAAGELGLGRGATWMDRATRVDIDIQLASCILMRRQGVDCQEAHELLLRACAALERLIEEQPEQLAFRVDLGAAWNNLAAAANEIGEHAVARDRAGRAIDAQAQVLERAPDHRLARLYLGMHHGQHAFALARLGDHGAAVASAQLATEFAPRHTMTLRMAAEAAAIATGSTGEDRHARLAVAALERIADADADEARRWLRAERFAHLRGRADFASLADKVGVR